jgi:hypothetical protein
VQLTPFSCYFIPLGSKFSPYNPVLKHTQSVFLKWETTFHTHSFAHSPALGQAELSHTTPV